METQGSAVWEPDDVMVGDKKKRHFFDRLKTFKFALALGLHHGLVILSITSMKDLK